MDNQEHNHGQTTSNKLRLIRSPLVGEDKLESDSASAYHQAGRADVESLGFRDGPKHDCPEFQRREEATNIELFFDLFFAANLTVFSEIHVVTDREKLVSYIGYFCMLWFTWALVGLFDVRFVTDSIFERIARAGHLGVMIGFAVVAPNFDPNHQNKQTFRTMSIILMVSRLLMVVQYGTIIWHVRKYRNTKLPLSLMVGIHFIAAMIYLGITFRFRDYNSRVYIAWYIIAVVETALNVAFSLVWDVLSFKGTHFTNRMSLLTLIIIGEGIIVVCSNVTTIVKNPNSWTAATIGSVTAGIATIYIVYQIYFDWQRHIHLPPIRQLCWAFLHFPFHLALTLFVHGSSQFIMWWKILEVIARFQHKVINAFSADIPEEASYRNWFIDTLNRTVEDIFELYPPVYVNTYIDVDDSFDKLKTLNESFFRADTLDSGPESALFNKSLSNIITSVENSLFTSFNIDSVADTEYDGDAIEFETEVNRENWNRFYLVFIYTFVTAGLVLMLMNLLFIISRMKRWSPFNIFRAVLNFLIGLGLALVSLIQLNDSDASQYQSTPWILPTLCLTFFVVLVINHLPKPPPLFFKRKSRSLKPERTILLGGPQYEHQQGPPKLQDQHLPANTEYHNGQHLPTTTQYYNDQNMPTSTEYRNGQHTPVTMEYQNGQNNGQYTSVPL